MGSPADCNAAGPAKTSISHTEPGINPSSQEEGSCWASKQQHHSSVSVPYRSYLGVVVRLGLFRQPPLIMSRGLKKSHHHNPQVPIRCFQRLEQRNNTPRAENRPTDAAQSIVRRASQSLHSSISPTISKKLAGRCCLDPDNFPGLTASQPDMNTPYPLTHPIQICILSNLHG